MKSSVRQVRLKLSVPESEREQVPDLRRSTESRFIPDLLSACRDRLHREFGEHRLVFVRRLSLRCAFESGELADPEVARCLGCDLAESLIAGVARLDAARRLNPAESDNVVVLEGEAHRDALAVARRAKGEPLGWFLEEVEPSLSIWAATCDAGARALREFVDCLARLGVLEAVLRDLPETVLTRALEQLRFDDWPEDARSVLRARGGSALGREPSSPESDRAAFATPPSTGSENALGAARTAREHPGVSGVSSLSPSSGEPAPSLASPIEALPPSDCADAPALVSLGEEPFRNEANDRAVQDRAVAVEVPATREAAPVVVATGKHSEQSSIVFVSLSPEGRDPVTPDQHADPARSHAGTNDSSEAALLDETRFAGLFYLVRLVLELELAEHLWCAGIPEGPFLTEVARSLLGDERRHDCAPLLFGGAGTLPPIEDWAFTEVTAKTRACLEGWLRARDIDRAGLPAIDELSLQFRSTPELPPRTAELVCFYSATLSMAFCAALGETPSRERLAAHLRRPGRVELGSELCIVLPMSALETPVRRAGLDFNPGYVPWQRRMLVIRFEERQGDGGASASASS